MARKLVLSCYASLDGVIQDPVGMEDSGLGNWTGAFNRGSEGDRVMHEELMASDIVLLGRTTYDGFAAVWPGIDDPAGFGRKMNSMRKFVASNTMKQAEWTNTSVLSGDVTSAVRELKSEDGGDILMYGSAGLAHTLMRHNVIDEVRMMIYPVVLGQGTRLFPSNYASTFELKQVKPLGSGIVRAEYLLSKA